MDSTWDESQHKKRKKMKMTMKASSDSCQSLFLSLPDDVIFNCLARVSKWDHPRLCLVSKAFRSIMASPELHMAQSLLGRGEHCLHVCIRVPLEPIPRWFALRPTTTRNKLVPLPPSSFVLPTNSSVVAMGSEIYVIGGLINEKRVSDVLIFDSKSHKWRRVKRMGIPRRFPIAGVVEGKIYVIGGCDAFSEYLGETYDPTTRAWKRLPYSDTAFDAFQRPFLDMRHGVVMNRKLYGIVGLKCFCYDPKNGKWETVANPSLNSFRSSFCVVKNVLYCCDLSGSLLWHDFQNMEWRPVKGLELFPRFPPLSKMANYGGNLAVLSERGVGDPVRSEISCTEIALARHGNGEIWARVVWSDVVFTFTDLGRGHRLDILHCVAVTM